MDADAALIPHLSDPESLGKLVQIGMRAEVIISADVRGMYQFALEYYMRGSVDKAPTLDILRDEYPQWFIRHSDSIPEELVLLDYVIERLTTRFKRNQLQEAITTAGRISVDDPDEALSLGLNEFARITFETTTQERVEPYALKYHDRLQAYYDRVLEESETRAKGRGFKVGFEMLTEWIWGLKPAEFAVLAAPPATGKSWALTKIALEAALEGAHVYFASLENPKEMTMMRLDCFDDQTEVLTDEGWKYLSDVTGESVATMAHDGRLEYQRPTAKIAKPYSGPLVTCSKIGLDFAVTPHHRMVVGEPGAHEILEAERLIGSRHHIPCVPAIARTGEDRPFFAPHPVLRTTRWGRWSPESEAYLKERYAVASAEELSRVLRIPAAAIAAKARRMGISRPRMHNSRMLPETPAVLVAEYVGFWLAEGFKHRGKETIQVVVTQTKPSGVAYVDDLFVRLGWPVRRAVYGTEVRWTITSAELATMVSELVHGDELRLPSGWRAWSPETQRALLRGYVAGDGTITAVGTRNLWSTSKLLIDELQAMASHAGIRTSLLCERKAGESGYEGWPPARRDMWRLVLWRTARRSRIEASDIVVKPYEGMVYCLTVPNGTLYVRRRGAPMWAGNCMLTGVPWEAYERGRLDLNQKEALKAGQEVLESLELNERLIVDCPLRESERGVFELYARARQRGCNLVVGDQLSWVSPRDGYRGDRSQQMVEVTTDIAVYSREFKLASIWAAQFNREGHKAGRGKLHQIGLTSNIEQIVDFVFGIGASDEQRANEYMVVEILKSRRTQLNQWIAEWKLGKATKLEILREFRDD